MIQNERVQPQAPAHSAQPHQPHPMPTATTEPPQVAQIQSTHSLLDVLSTPILEDVFWLVGTRVAAKWKSVAIYLGIEACVIDIISTNCPKDCEEACIDMLQRWLAIDNHIGEKEQTCRESALYETVKVLPLGGDKESVPVSHGAAWTFMHFPRGI